MFDDNVNKADDMFSAMNRAFGSGMGFGKFMIGVIGVIVLAWTVYLLMNHTPVGKHVREFLAKRGIMSKKIETDEDGADGERPRPKRRLPI